MQLRMAMLTWVMLGAAGTCASAWAADLSARPVPAQAKDVQAAYPGVRVHTGVVSAEPLVALYGRGMTTGVTPQAAADNFVALHGAALWNSGTVPELQQVRATFIKGNTHTVFAYKQMIDGLPVEYGVARVLVRHADATGDNQVVYAAAKLLDRPLGGFTPQIVTSDDALMLAQGQLGFRHLDVWGAPELVVIGVGELHLATRAWKVVGMTSDVHNQDAYSLFFDATTGELIHTRREIYHVDVSGTVQGNGSPGLLPDYAGNPPAPLTMPNLRVDISGGNSAFTDPDGDYTIANGGAGTVTVSTSLDNGQWFNINDSSGGAVVTGSLLVTPPGPGNLLINPIPSEFLTAQINAARHTALIHNYYKDRAPSFTDIDLVLSTNVNINQTCNANFNSANLSINFFRAGGGCRNTAYSTVVAHEYGHFVVNRLGLAQGAFGEGFSDVSAIMLHDTPTMGEQFRDNGTYVRDVEIANQQYPCSDAIHTCGQVLGGSWWDMRQEFGGFYGSAAGLELVRQLQVDWAMITIGGSGSNAAHPATVIEVLTVDDNDSNLDNGTPNYALICPAFAKHGLACPELQLIGFEFPEGIPSMLDPDDATEVPVNVVSIGSSPVPGTGTLTYQSSLGGPFTIPMTQNAPNQYVAAIPAVACGLDVSFYFSAQESGGAIVHSPSGAPAVRYSAVSAYSSESEDETFEASNGGWTVGAPGDNATTGIWVHVNPNGTAAQPEDDHTPDPGALCWVTGQGSLGGALGENDVDGGTTTLVSDTMDLSGVAGAKVSYWRWYSNNTGAAPNSDVFTVQISNNDGFSWTTLETVGPSGPETAGGWFFKEFNVASPTSQVKVRFQASDLGSGSIVEAAIDDFSVKTFSCVPPPPTCDGDLDGDNDVDSTDLNILLTDFGCTSSCIGDIDGDGDTDSTDLNIMLSVFGEPCV